MENKKQPTIWCKHAVDDLQRCLRKQYKESCQRIFLGGQILQLEETGKGDGLSVHYETSSFFIALAELIIKLVYYQIFLVIIHAVSISMSPI